VLLFDAHHCCNAIGPVALKRALPRLQYDLRPPQKRQDALFRAWTESACILMVVGFGGLQLLENHTQPPVFEDCDQAGASLLSHRYPVSGSVRGKPRLSTCPLGGRSLNRVTLHHPARRGGGVCRCGWASPLGPPPPLTGVVLKGRHPPFLMDLATLISLSSSGANSAGFWTI